MPPVMMLLCLLLMFNSQVPRTCDVEYVELFAGAAQISRHCFGQGMVGSSHDIEYSSHFDLCGRTGFLNHGDVKFLLYLLHDQNYSLFLYDILVYLIWQQHRE